MIRIKQYKFDFTNQLISIYDEKEIESFFYLSLEKLHHLKRIDLALNPNLEMDDTQLEIWNSVVLDLKKQKPIQYILGETEFYGLKFQVNKNTLIPRPETEELVELIISNNRKIEKSKNLKILDIGTGTGCIPIALKENMSNTEIYAIDISKKALETAKKNAEINKVEINFIHGDILKIPDLVQLPDSNFQLPTKFDIIVSNPPYVRKLEKKEIKPNVLEYEPHLALFVEDHDPLLFYRKIGQLALKNLSSEGQLYFEINQYLGKEMIQMLEEIGFVNIELKKDLYGNDRMIYCGKSV